MADAILSPSSRPDLTVHRVPYAPDPEMTLEQACRAWSAQRADAKDPALESAIVERLDGMGVVVVDGEAYRVEEWPPGRVGAGGGRRRLLCTLMFRPDAPLAWEFTGPPDGYPRHIYTNTDHLIRPERR